MLQKLQRQKINNDERRTGNLGKLLYLFSLFLSISLSLSYSPTHSFGLLVVDIDFTGRQRNVRLG